MMRQRKRKNIREYNQKIKVIINPKYQCLKKCKNQHFNNFD